LSEKFRVLLRAAKGKITFCKRKWGKNVFLSPYSLSTMIPNIEYIRKQKDKNIEEYLEFNKSKNNKYCLKLMWKLLTTIWANS
jgi:hypothetical protein